MKTFSLRSMLLLVVIVALCLSQVKMMQELNDARAEIEIVRSKYGYIHVDDANMTYVSRVPSECGQAYRIIVPAGSRYMLHLTDQASENGESPETPIATKSISLNGWRDGADTILFHQFDPNDKTPTLVVHSTADEFFNYTPPDWISGTRPINCTHLEIDIGEQKAFAIDETIEFMWRQNPTTKRGLMLWLEPYATYKARKKAKNAG